MKRMALAIFGLLLVALAAAWFLTDLPQTVQAWLQSGGLAQPSARSLTRDRSWDTIKTGLDVANALIGCVGIYLSLRTLRQGRSTSA